MPKVSKLAVLLAGDFRTFPQAAEYIFEHAESQAESVDYFFACWDHTSDSWYNQEIREQTRRPVTDQELIAPFQLHNAHLVDYVLLSQEERSHLPNNTAYYQCYLGKVACILKRKHELESQMVYDMVIELRPDLFINANSCPDRLNDFKVNLEYDLDRAQFPCATDFYYRCNSFTNDVMSERYNHSKIEKGNYFFFENYLTSWPMPMNAHWLPLDYIYSRRLEATPNFAPATVMIPIRPTFPKEDLRKIPVSKLVEIFDKYWDDTRGKKS